VLAVHETRGERAADEPLAAVGIVDAKDEALAHQLPADPTRQLPAGLEAVGDRPGGQDGAAPGAEPGRLVLGPAGDARARASAATAIVGVCGFMRA